MTFEERESLTRRVALRIAKISAALVLVSVFAPVYVQDVDSDFVCSNVALFKLGLVDLDGSACGRPSVFDDRARWTVRFLLAYSAALTVWVAPPPRAWMSDWR